jgi:hypothetical protein
LHFAVQQLVVEATSQGLVEFQRTSGFDVFAEESDKMDGLEDSSVSYFFFLDVIFLNEEGF